MRSNIELGVAAVLLSITSLAIISSKAPYIENLRVKEEDALSISVEYKYPNLKNRNLLLVKAWGSFGFIKDKSDWDFIGENYLIQEKYDIFGYSGKVVLTKDYPNSRYYLIIDKRYHVSNLKNYKYEKHIYNNFTVYSNGKFDKKLFEIFDNHISRLEKKEGKNINPFEIYILNKKIISEISGNRIIFGEISELEVIHEFAHVFSLFNNSKIINILANLYLEADKYAENKYLNTKIGHPHRNISELAASIITLYLKDKLEITEEIKYIANFYLLDELKSELYGIISDRK